ncbi:MAG TPA: oxygen-independent coproporphyrinogen III oxidase [Clostridiales bacterium]|nr:oxygen-independent coproporphyrinogen III oxidase [Clostridiales bacterium]
MKEIGLYIHIPFCERKCNYCDFLSFKADEEMNYRYVEALLLEIKSYKLSFDEYLVSTIYIGGGTPSLINAFLIVDIINGLKDTFTIKGINDKSKEEAEITIEINPGTVNEAKLKRYFDIGINRISFGLQSTNNDELKLLGRIHNYKQFEDNYMAARKIGFKNINIDLISALPNQTNEKWMETLNKVISLSPEHISAYTLIIEEKTQFYTDYVTNTEGKKDLPDEELDRLIYKTTTDILNKAGYKRYEISNYALENYESKHNTSYWIGKEYLGLGIGSSSYVNNSRFNNLKNIEQYISKVHSNYLKNNIERIDIMEDCLNIRENIQVLSNKEMIEEFMFLGLRLAKGISKNEFKEKFKKDINDIYKEEILKLLKQNLIKETKDRIYLTDLGIDLSNHVFTNFI